MDNSINSIKYKYTQAREFYKNYSKDFLNKVASGIISNKSIRKLNIISMWLDYMQNYFKEYSRDSLYSGAATLSELQNILDQIAFEFKIVYKSEEKSNIQSLQSSTVASQQTFQNNNLEADGGALLAENGAPIELDLDSTGLQNFNRNPLRSSNSSSPSRSSSSNSSTSSTGSY